MDQRDQPWGCIYYFSLAGSFYGLFQFSGQLVGCSESIFYLASFPDSFDFSYGPGTKLFAVRSAAANLHMCSDMASPIIYEYISRLSSFY